MYKVHNLKVVRQYNLYYQELFRNADGSLGCTVPWLGQPFQRVHEEFYCLNWQWFVH